MSVGIFNMKDSCDHSFKAIILFSKTYDSLGELSNTIMNYPSYKLSRSFLLNQIEKDISFFTSSRNILLKEFNKKYGDGSNGTEFLIEQNYKTYYQIREKGTKCKKGSFSFQNFNNDFEFFLKSDSDSNYVEEFDLLFLDYGKRFHFFLEDLFKLLNSLNLLSELDDENNIGKYYNNILREESEWYLKWYQKEKIPERSYPFDLKFLEKKTFNMLMYYLLKYFELPELILKQKEISIYPEKTITYQGLNYWVSPDGINDKFVSDSGVVKDEVVIFPSIESWFSWEFLGIKNRKRCKICGNILPEGYKGKYCSKEQDPECRKKMERLKKQKMLPQ